MLDINPSLKINNDEVIISNLVIGRRITQHLSEIGLANKANISVEKLYAIEEGYVLLSDSDYQEVLNVLKITDEDIRYIIEKCKV